MVHDLWRFCLSLSQKRNMPYSLHFLEIVMPNGESSLFGAYSWKKEPFFILKNDFWIIWMLIRCKTNFWISCLQSERRNFSTSNVFYFMRAIGNKWICFQTLFDFTSANGSIKFTTSKTFWFVAWKRDVHMQVLKFRDNQTFWRVMVHDLWRFFLSRNETCPTVSIFWKESCQMAKVRF